MLKTHELVVNSKVVEYRLPWMQRDNPNSISTRIHNGNLKEAAATLDRQAASRGLRIVEAARIHKDGIDFAFGRGA